MQSCIHIIDLQSADLLRLRISLSHASSKCCTLYYCIVPLLLTDRASWAVGTPQPIYSAGWWSRHCQFLSLPDHRLPVLRRNCWWGERLRVCDLQEEELHHLQSAARKRNLWAVSATFESRSEEQRRGSSDVGDVWGAKKFLFRNCYLLIII